jgi:hypothetical protein
MVDRGQTDRDQDHAQGPCHTDAPHSLDDLEAPQHLVFDGDQLVQLASGSSCQRPGMYINLLYQNL